MARCLQGKLHPYVRLTPDQLNLPILPLDLHQPKTIVKVQSVSLSLRDKQKKVWRPFISLKIDRAWIGPVRQHLTQVPTTVAPERSIYRPSPSKMRAKRFDILHRDSRFTSNLLITDTVI
jgi:hypothetical protein